MPWRENLHSRFVAWMKIVLPLAALGILSTLFLISNGFDPNQTLPVAGIDLQERAQSLGATGATFAGVSSEGHEVTMRTERTRPSAADPRLIEARDVTARMTLNSGVEIDLSSHRGEVDQRDNSATLTGDVRITTSSGYVLTTDRLNAGFDTLYAETPGPVEGRAPAGDLTAGRMVLRDRPDTGGPHLVFSNGVKLIYQPPKPGE
ncbi:MAG TPA: hypothetical protein DEP84_03955 [Chloroflexi bacterium]|nr:hypothetical protein [Chloroflexota bacterium]